METFLRLWADRARNSETPRLLRTSSRSENVTVPFEFAVASRGAGAIEALSVVLAIEVSDSVSARQVEVEWSDQLLP